MNVYVNFKVRIKHVTYMETIKEEFNGVVYTRCVNAKDVTHRRYYYGKRPNSKRRTLLHRDKWEFYNGKIPEGYHIHHKDENPLNNDLSNLECLSKVDHHKRHAGKAWHAMSDEQRKEQLAKMHEAGKNWHYTPEGIKHHKELAAANLANRVLIEKTCTYCGKKYEVYNALSGRPKFCSPKCRGKVERQKKYNYEKRICIVCNGEFDISKYSGQIACSRACGYKYRTINSPHIANNGFKVRNPQSTV